MRESSGASRQQAMFITRWMSRVAGAMCGWCLPQPRTNVQHHVIKQGLGVERNPMDLASPVPLYFENDLDVDPEEDELDSMDMVFYNTKVDYIPKNSKTLTTIEKEKNNNKKLKSPVIIQSPMGNKHFKTDNINLNMNQSVKNEKYQSTYYEVDNAELNEINTNNLNSLTIASQINRPTHLDLGASVYRPSLITSRGNQHCYSREVSMDLDDDGQTGFDNRDYIVDHRGDSTMFNVLRTFRCFEGVDTPHLAQQFLPMEVRRPPGKMPMTHMDGYAPINQTAIIY